MPPIWTATAMKEKPKGKAKPSKDARASFDAGRSRRRLSGWTPTSVSINTLLASDGNLMRNRARDVVRNNPHAASGRDSFVGNFIGTGIKPSSLVTDAKLKKQIQELFLDWTDEADADGLCDFYGLEKLAGDALFEAGEFFVRFRARKLSDGLAVPFQLQFLESELLPFEDNRMLANGNTVKNGVEFDFRGKRVAYHFLREHPGDMQKFANNIAKTEIVRVPAEEVLHVFEVRRPGQIRGVPRISAAIVKLFMLDQYDDAELDRKKTAAMYAGFIKSPEPEGIMAPITGVEDKPSEGIASLEPGTMQVLLPGEEIEFSAPADVGGSYELFQYRNILAAFAAMGVPYTLGTSDLKRANYSSLRGAMVEYRRKIEQLQHMVLVFQFCRPVWKRFMDDAVLSGAIAIPDYLERRRYYQRAKWIAPRFEWVDPLKDWQAEAVAVANGFKSRSDVIEETGSDPEETDERIAADQERQERLGIEIPGSKQVNAIKPDNPSLQDQLDAEGADTPNNADVAA